MNVTFKQPANSTRTLDSIAEALLLPSGVDGVYARTATFEQVVNGLTDLISEYREPNTEVLRFPPVMSRRQVEKSGYLKSFPHFLGCVSCLAGEESHIREAVDRHEAGEDWTPALSSADLVLARRPAIRSIRLWRAAAKSRRRDSVRRGLRLLPPRTVEDAGPAAIVSHARICLHRHARQIDAFRRRWMKLAEGFAGRLGLSWRIDYASDPFFGRVGQLMAVSQVEQALKFELLIPVHSTEKPTACMSFNYHRDHFGTTWNIHTGSGEVAHTGCVAFGIDRLALALFATHGLELARWPDTVRKSLGI